MKADTCADCRFYFPLDGPDVGTGGCRRYPPTIVLNPTDGIDLLLGEHPHVLEDDWCGEHVLDHLKAAAAQGLRLAKKIPA